MSFVGAVARPVREVLATFAPGLQGPALVVGAGNFTVPSALRSGGYRGAIRACDVSLYTSALGAFLSGGRLEVRERPDCPAHLAGLLRPEDPRDLAASVALLLDLREVWKADNPYKARAVEAMRREWDGLLDRARVRLDRLREHLGPVEYQARDGFEILQSADPDAAVFAFPPTYKRGYEKLEALFAAVLEWTPPAYREMTDVSPELYEAIARFRSWFVVLEKGQEELPAPYAVLGQPVAVLPRGRGTRTFILARSAPRRIVVRQQVKSAPAGPVWPPDRAVSPGLAIQAAPLTLAQSLRLNELFLSSRIDYFTGGVGLSLGFVLDGRIIGKADFCKSAHAWKLPTDAPMVYLMCDLAVPSAVEPRLAKLVLACLLSREVRDLLDLRFLERFAWVGTTAFSVHPQSMKYRGAFKLHARKKTPGGFSLNYFAAFGAHTLAQGLASWCSKRDGARKTGTNHA